MKKIVRLTESDLTRIVKKIINEQTWGGILDMPETGQEVTGMVGINQNVASKTEGQVDAALMTEVKKNHPLFLNYLKSKGLKETSTKLILNSGPFVITYQYEINPTWKWPGNGKFIITKPDTKKYGLYNLDMTDKFKKIKPLFKEGKRYILVENNSHGQFGKLLRQETGVEIKEKILKYDGRAITVEEIIDKL